jgi:hypothetical protein
LLDGAPNVRLIINIRVVDTMRRAESGDHPAHVHSHAKCADPVAPIGPRSSRADSTGGKRRALTFGSLVTSLPLTMTRALGLLS